MVCPSYGHSNSVAPIFSFSLEDEGVSCILSQSDISSQCHSGLLCCLKTRGRTEGFWAGDPYYASAPFLISLCGC